MELEEQRLQYIADMRARAATLEEAALIPPQFTEPVPVEGAPEAGFSEDFGRLVLEPPHQTPQTPAWVRPPNRARGQEGYLYVRIAQARGLPDTDSLGGKSDVFATLTIRSNVRPEGAKMRRLKTHVRRMPNLRWEEEFVLPVWDSSNDVLEVRLWDFDLLSKNDPLGRADLGIGHRALAWVNLEGPGGGGQLEMEMHFRQEEIPAEAEEKKLCRKLDDFRLVFERGQGYLPGQEVKGMAVLNLTEDLSLYGLQLEVESFARTSVTVTETYYVNNSYYNNSYHNSSLYTPSYSTFNNNNNNNFGGRYGNRNRQTRTRTYTERRTFIEATQVLFGSRERDSNILAAGHHQWAFSFRLPASLPPSFSSGGASISHECRLRLRRPGLDRKRKSPFLVAARFAREVWGPSASASKRFLGQEGTVRLSGSLETSEVAAGEMACVNLHITNNSEQELTQAAIKLKGSTRYSARGHSESTSYSTSSMHYENEFPIGPGQTRDLRLVFPIPFGTNPSLNLAVSGGLIEHSVTLNIRVSAGTFRLPAKLSLPIIIHPSPAPISPLSELPPPGGVPAPMAPDIALQASDAAYFFPPTAAIPGQFGYQ